MKTQQLLSSVKILKHYVLLATSVDPLFTATVEGTKAGQLCTKKKVNHFQKEDVEHNEHYLAVSDYTNIVNVCINIYH